MKMFWTAIKAAYVTIATSGLCLFLLTVFDKDARTALFDFYDLL